MKKSDVCENCKKLITQHTQDELLSCSLEIAKNENLPENDDDVINSFNAIKSGEASRMYKRSSATKEDEN